MLGFIAIGIIVGACCRRVGDALGAGAAVGIVLTIVIFVFGELLGASLVRSLYLMDSQKEIRETIVGLVALLFVPPMLSALIGHLIRRGALWILRAIYQRSA